VKTGNVGQLGNGHNISGVRGGSVAIKKDYHTEKDKRIKIVVPAEDEGKFKAKQDEEEGDLWKKLILSKRESEESKSSLSLEGLASHQAQMRRHSTEKLVGFTSHGIAAGLAAFSPRDLDGVKLKKRRHLDDDDDDDDDAAKTQLKRLKDEPTDVLEGLGSTLKSATISRTLLRASPEPDINRAAPEGGIRSASKIIEANILVDNSTHDPASSGSSREVVLDPARLRRILSRIGIDWELATISRCLSKDIVFQTYSLPCAISLPFEAPSMEFRQILAFAEFLFAASEFEDAFPLFLLVWIALRHKSGCRDVIALVQCARTAKQCEDRMLVISLLQESLWMLDDERSQSVVIRSLFRLELAQLYLAHGLIDDSRRLYCDGIDIILPERSSLIETFNTAQQELRDDAASPWNTIESYNLSQDIVLHALDGASLGYKEMWLRPDNMPATLCSDNYTLRDVLLANIYLAHNHDRSVAASGVRHLRGCLKHAEGILRRSWCRDSYRDIRAKIGLHWPGFTRATERAVFFDLVINWSPLQFCKYLDIEHHNSFTGLSTLGIISTTSFLVSSENGLLDAIDLRYQGNVESRVAGLIALSDEALLLGFLWSTVRQDRMRSYDDMRQAGCLRLWTDWMTEIYTTLKKGKWEEQIMFEPSPTLAASIITSSTLSTMRKHSRMVHFSTNCELNLRSRSTLCPVQQWINLTADQTSVDDISKAMNEFTVDGDSLCVGDEELYSETLDGNTIGSQNSSPEMAVSMSNQSQNISMIEKDLEIAVIGRYSYKPESDLEEQPRDGG
jgi:hypothetical protein